MCRLDTGVTKSMQTKSTGKGQALRPQDFIFYYLNLDANDFVLDTCMSVVLPTVIWYTSFIHALRFG